MGAVLEDCSQCLRESCLKVQLGKETQTSLSTKWPGGELLQSCSGPLGLGPILKVWEQVRFWPFHPSTPGSKSDPACATCCS